MSLQIRHQAVLIVAGAVMFFINLGVPRLWDVDEAIFSQAAWEMMDRGDLVTPYFNGKVFPDKPALMYWFMIAGYELFGPTEFAARFWSAAFGLGTVLLTYQLGRKLFSPAVGLWSGLILASSLNFAVIARAATPDAELAFFCTLAVVAFVFRTPPEGGWIKERDGTSSAATGAEFQPSWSTYMLVYAAMALAFLTKGPVGVVLPTAVIGLFSLCSSAPPLAAETSQRSGPRRWLAHLVRGVANLLAPGHVCRTIWSMRPLTAMAMVALIAGPWYVWVGLRTGGEWPAGFFGVHNFGRFLNAMDNHRGPIFYYLLAICIGFFPWSIFLTPSLLQLAQRIRERHACHRGYLLIVCWLVVWVGFFSLASTKLPSYIIPAYPALAMFTAAFLDTWMRETALVSRTWMRLAWGIFLVSALGFVIAVPIVAHLFLAGDLVLGLFGLPLVLGALVAWYFSEREQPLAAVRTLAVSSVVFVTGLLGFAAVRVDRHQISEPLAGVIARESESDRPQIGYFRFFRPSFVFYTKRPLAECRSPEQVAAFFEQQPSDAFLITTEEQLSQLTPVLPPDVAVVDRRPLFLKRGQLVLLGRTGNAASAQTAQRTDVLNR